mgnify:CR=1 FL=1
MKDQDRNHQRSTGNTNPRDTGTTTKTSNPPKTGDTAKAGLWLAIAALSAMGVGGVAIHARKKKKAPLAIEEKKEESEDE